MNKRARLQPLAGRAKNLNPPSEPSPILKTIPQSGGQSLQSSQPAPINEVDLSVVINEQPQDSISDQAKGGRTLGQILVVLVVIVLLVNVPISYRGGGLIHSVPDATPVTIYDGIVLKGSGPKIYTLEDHKLRQFNKPDVFDYFQNRYRLEVHPVDDSLLDSFQKGRPIHRLVSCKDLPHTYALESGQKRWVKNPLYINQANPWDSVRLVGCNYLQSVPDGLPVPDDER